MDKVERVQDLVEGANAFLRDGAGKKSAEHAERRLGEGDAPQKLSLRGEDGDGLDVVLGVGLTDGV